MKKSWMIAAVALIALVLAYSIPAFSQGPMAQARVAIKGYAFQPGTVTIAKGSTVTWTNQDPVKHTVKFGTEESPQLSTGQTYAKTFNSPGTFSYMCGIHPYMKGTVIVK